MLIFTGTLFTTTVTAAVLSVTTERPFHLLEKLLCDTNSRDDVNKVKNTIKSFARSAVQNDFTKKLQKSIAIFKNFKRLKSSDLGSARLNNE